MNKEPDPMTVSGAWYYIYGAGSFLTPVGRLLVCVPLFPVIVPLVAFLLIAHRLLDKDV